MDYPFPLVMYYVSGWTINIGSLFIAWYALKSTNIWKGRHLFLGLNFCFSAVFELIGSVTAVLLVNNLFVDYLYIPADFAFTSLYLSGAHNSKKVRFGTYILIFLFILMQVYKVSDEEGYKHFNALGAYANTTVIFFYSFWNLTILFKKRSPSYQLRQNPDLWFTVTILCLCFIGFAVSVLAEVTYAAGSAKVFYPLYISRNLIYTASFYGYYKGIRLLG